MSVAVRETVLRAYGFAGRRALPLIGLGWLTAVFYFAATAYFLGRLSATMLVWPRPDKNSPYGFRPSTARPASRFILRLFDGRRLPLAPQIIGHGAGGDHPLDELAP